MLSPWMQQRLESLRRHDQGEVEHARPLTLTHHNTQRLLRRVRQTRDEAVAWKPDIGALEPRLVKRFSDDIAGRAQTLRLIGVRRQPSATTTAWDSTLELVLPTGPATPAGQVIERFSPSAAQGPSVFAAGQPIEPFKLTAPIPARSSRPTAAARPTRKPASKQLPPQARRYARVEEITPRGAMPERETGEPVAAPVAPRETPQPARERPAIQRAPMEETPQAEAITPPAAALPMMRVQRQAEPEPPASPERPTTAPPQQPERAQAPLPVERTAAPDAARTPQKPASLTPPVPLPATITPARPGAEMPLAATPSPVEQTPPSPSAAVEAPGIQRAAKTPTPRAESSQPRPVIEAPVMAKPVAPREPMPRLPRAIPEPLWTGQPARARLPHALPVKPSPHIAAPVERSATPSAPRPVTTPGPRPQPEPPAVIQMPSRAVISPARPLEAPHPPSPPVAMPPKARVAMPDQPHVDIPRAAEPPRGPERTEAQWPSPITAPPEPRRAVPLPAVTLAESAIRPTITDTAQRRGDAVAAQPTENIETPPPSDLQSPVASFQSSIPDLPLRQVIQRRADARSHGLLRQPASPPTLRPLVKTQPRKETGSRKLDTGSWKRDAGNGMMLDAGSWKLDAGRERPAGTGAAGLTLYARSPNMFVGPGPAPTVTRRTPPARREQQRVQDERAASQPPLELRMAGGKSNQPLAIGFQPSAVSPQWSAGSPQPSVVSGQPSATGAAVAMPLVRQEERAAHTTPPAPRPGPPTQVAETITRPAIVGELIQREASGEREEETPAPEPVNLGELARRVYPFVKRLIAIERERSNKT